MFTLFTLTEWIGIGAGYFVALALILGGIYVAFVLVASPWAAPFARLLRFAGLSMVGVGLMLAAFNYGKATGAADCQAAWKAKNYEAKITRLKQEADAKKTAAEEAEKSLKEIASQKEEADGKVADYQVSTARLANALASCRRASVDDDRRLCDIIGRSAPGCKSAR